jgi:hypothetical protein
VYGSFHGLHSQGVLVFLPCEATGSWQTSELQVGAIFVNRRARDHQCAA